MPFSAPILSETLPEFHTLEMCDFSNLNPSTYSLVLNFGLMRKEGVHQCICSLKSWDRYSCRTAKQGVLVIFEVEMNDIW